MEPVVALLDLRLPSDAARLVVEHLAATAIQDAWRRFWNRIYAHWDVTRCFASYAYAPDYVHPCRPHKCRIFGDWGAPCAFCKDCGVRSCGACVRSCDACGAGPVCAFCAVYDPRREEALCRWCAFERGRMF